MNSNFSEQPRATVLSSNPQTTLGQAQRRLMRDLRDLNLNKVEGICASPVDAHNIYLWNAIITGPPDSIFEDGTFQLTMKFNENYPNQPPEIRFVTKMLHPNIYTDGSLCLDILQNRWSASLDVSSVLISIRSLLIDPNPNSPANSAAAILYRDNRREYERQVRELIEESWREDLDTDNDDNSDDEEMKNKTRATTTTTTTNTTREQENAE
ncbi:unnamed protein product [Didymodactylos carnosus]|uniref:UBC core domain-containing protein n=1 Tax=Didymodactylos carnosus TaxID=1234261 RepID=A0A814SR70_9BILA|nr:unnamed protein product [Didymodactylos carnosus]CAF1344624.1 unnamed protein product [Didymodactylos carnosus]CAF3911636.1 unnamed protein product [Didymodactylos carnosus]CAF4155723.1 unnamed protein product [Didymodactylos carnosus]